MKKIFILTAFFFLLGDYLFSQTWTVRQDENWDIEWRVITREEWNRLRTQKEAQYAYATLIFTDILEISRSLPVIKGTRPQLIGYFYLLGNVQPRTKQARDAQNLTGLTTYLSYGNSRTGDFDIAFYNSSGFIIPDVYSIGSNSYNNRYNQCIRWVNGE
jgi:hypothetical protein